MRRFLIWSICIIASTSCQRHTAITPKLAGPDSITFINQLPSVFEPLERQEKATAWAKELYSGKEFAKEGDLYRAITSFKKAKFLTKWHKSSREHEIAFDTMLSYYLAKKYEDAIDVFEKSALMTLKKSHPLYSGLLIMLYESALAENKELKVSQIFPIIQQESLDAGHKMLLYKALYQGNTQELGEHITGSTEGLSEASIQANRSFAKMLRDFESGEKSIRQAEVFNAILPGAGYIYVGQIQSGVTSFLLNALFIATAWEFFHEGQTAAGILAAGFEIGWYVGGIRGAGLAAKQYNDTLYSSLAQKHMMQEKIFPLFELHYGF